MIKFLAQGELEQKAGVHLSPAKRIHCPLVTYSYLVWVGFIDATLKMWDEDRNNNKLRGLSS